jgi:hypothetical protein
MLLEDGIVLRGTVIIHGEFLYDNNPFMSAQLHRIARFRWTSGMAF